MQSSKGMTFSLLLQMESSLHWKCRREKPQISLFLNIFILQFRFSSSFENLLFLPCQTSQTSYCGSKMLYSYLCICFWSLKGEAMVCGLQISLVTGFRWEGGQFCQAEAAQLILKEPNQQPERFCMPSMEFGNCCPSNVYGVPHS